VLVVLVSQDAAQPLGHHRQLRPVDHRPSGAVGQLEVVIDIRVRQHDRVRTANTRAAAPSRIAGDVRAKGVLGATRLTHRIDWLQAPRSRHHPPPTVVLDPRALDLEDSDAGARHHDREVDLVVLVVVGDPEVGDKDVVRTELLSQRLPDDPLAGVDEVRPLREADRHSGPSDAMGSARVGISVEPPQVVALVLQPLPETAPANCSGQSLACPSDRLPVTSMCVGGRGETVRAPGVSGCPRSGQRAPYSP